MTRIKQSPAKRRTERSRRKESAANRQIPFVEHLQELRRRFFFVAVTIVLGSVAGYQFRDYITNALLAPSGDQQFIFTTPGGGFDFVIRLCLYTGLLISIPVIIYQILRYLEPIIRRDARIVVVRGSIASAFLAGLGILFGYFIGLPAALRFLLQNFSSEHISALITIQSYMSFVMIYLFAAALLFQVPLILLIINRIKPLRPRKLMQFQRWFILFAFVFSAVISPTADLQNLLLLSIPMILMYQVGIALVWLTNRRRKPWHPDELLKRDIEIQEARLE